jgi:cobalt/nickel transport system permease protein
MSGGHGTSDRLVHAGDSVVHRLPAETKIVAALVFVVAVVATPSRSLSSLAIDTALLGVVVGLARLRLAWVLRRLRVELPFVAFAVFLPWFGGDPRVDALGLSLSEPGVWAAWNVLSKGTIGVLVAIVLVGTTPVAELLAGFERLRVPVVITGIAGFMIRYLDVVAGESDRIRVARLSRGGNQRWLWQARGVASSAGSLFVRSYERGERVHLAMLARGFDGSMPRLHEGGARPSAWAATATFPAAAVVLALLAHVG